MRWVHQLRTAARVTRRRAAGVVIVLAAVVATAVVATAVVAAAVVAVANAAAAEPLDLDRAQQRRDAAQRREQQLQDDLNVLLSRIEALKVARERQSQRIDELDTQLASERATADRAADQVAERYRQAYKAGTGGDPLVLLFGGASPDDVSERARLLGAMARSSKQEQEEADSASRRTAALSSELETARAGLTEQTGQLSASQRDARQKVEQAQVQVAQLDREITTERERRARQRRRRQAAARDAAASEEATAGAGDAGAAPAPVNDGIACPIGTPRSYSDTYGAPRSGGRSHLGVDMLAPLGTPIYAYEDGTVTRMDGNTLGGITLYLQGDSGTQYYYAHLSGYVSGIGAGDRVAVGQHIAQSGDSGNAAGIPHLHFEVRPGGGANVNPYPYAERACG